MQAAIEALGHSVSSVTAIVLTHAHPDHLGAAEHARKATGAPVHVHRPEVGRARGKARGSSPFTLVPGLAPTLWRPSTFGFVMHATVRGFMTPTWVSDLTPFDSGQELDVPGRPRVVATPGHTEGHVSLHLPQLGVVFTGDALASLDVLTRARGPRFMPDQLNGDPGAVRQSAEALGVLDAGTLLFGHGEPFTGEGQLAGLLHQVPVHEAVGVTVHARCHHLGVPLRHGDRLPGAVAANHSQRGRLAFGGWQSPRGPVKAATARVSGGSPRRRCRGTAP